MNTVPHRGELLTIAADCRDLLTLDKGDSRYLDLIVCLHNYIVLKGLSLERAEALSRVLSLSDPWATLRRCTSAERRYPYPLQIYEEILKVYTFMGAKSPFSTLF